MDACEYIYEGNHVSARTLYSISAGIVEVSVYEAGG